MLYICRKSYLTIHVWPGALGVGVGGSGPQTWEPGPAGRTRAASERRTGAERGGAGGRPRPCAWPACRAWALASVPVATVCTLPRCHLSRWTASSSAVSSADREGSGPRFPPPSLPRHPGGPRSSWQEAGASAGGTPCPGGGPPGPTRRDPRVSPSLGRPRQAPPLPWVPVTYTT